MDITPLSHVHPGVYNYIICVRVSRMWEFHGKNDDEAIKHLDLVLTDKKVSSIAVFRKRMKTNIQQFFFSSSVLDKCHIFIDYT